MSNPIRSIMIQRRRELGLTQQEAAKKAGCNESTWCRWESEQFVPRPAEWPRIAKVLGMSLADLQSAAAQKFNQLSSPTTAEAVPDGAGFAPRARPYAWANEEIGELVERLERMDLGKIDDTEAHHQMSQWRTTLVNAAMALDTQIRSLTGQIELYEKLFLGHVSESRKPSRNLVGVKIVVNGEEDENGELLHKNVVRKLVNNVSAAFARIRAKPSKKQPISPPGEGMILFKVDSN